MEAVFLLLLLLCCLAPEATPAASEGVDEVPFQFTGKPHLHPAGGEHVVDAGSTWTIRCKSNSEFRILLPIL